MFYIQAASDRRDKVYTLLGISLDDPNLGGLSADYDTLWS